MCLFASVFQVTFLCSFIMAFNLQSCLILLLSDLLLTPHSLCTEFNFTFDSRPKSNITSGFRSLHGSITIPDLFLDPLSKHRRRLKETPLTTPAPVSTTPPPTNQLALPIVLLIPPEGAHDRSLSIDGSQFNMDRTFRGHIFNDLATALANEGKLTVIRYDKRNCRDCPDIYPPFCPSESLSNPVQTPCFLEKDCCYNDTNITVHDVLWDAHRALTAGTSYIKSMVNPDIVDMDRIWTVPIGFSAQGASIAMMLASTVIPDTVSTIEKWYELRPTAISLMGSGVPITELLAIQLRAALSAMNATTVNGTDPLSIEEAVRRLQWKLECVRNGTLALNDTVDVDNGIFNESDLKLGQYWRDWMDLEEDIRFGAISNFMSINSNDDSVVSPEAFGPIDSLFESSGNGTVENYVFHDLNHFMVHLDDWKAGRWTVDERVSRHIIEYLDDVSGYLEDIQFWIDRNGTNHTERVRGGGTVRENAMVYKVCLYVAVMAIVLILALGVYCVVARKVCPFEFQDFEQNEQRLRRMRERERRRRRHRRRRRRQIRSSLERSSSQRIGMIDMSSLNPIVHVPVQNELVDEPPPYSAVAPIPSVPVPLPPQSNGHNHDEIESTNHFTENLNGADDEIIGAAIVSNIRPTAATTTGSTPLLSEQYVD